jgi:transposase-like protein
MHDEFTARQRSLTLRLGGRPVPSICRALGRSDFWFRKWWRRYLESGAEGLYDLTHATHWPAGASRRAPCRA